MGKATKRGYRYPPIVRANTGYVGKTIPMDKAFPNGEGCETRMPLFSHCQSEYTHMWRKTISTDKAFPAWGRWRAERAG